MTNHRLRNAMAAAELTNARLAEQVGVDTKSVERWVTQGRQPHPTTRGRVARVLGFEETYLWPALLTSSRGLGASQSELVQLWPTRNEVPADVWRTLISRAERRMEILVYAGGFLVETFQLVDLMRAKSELGAEVRILIGDASCEAVRARGAEEGLPTLPQRCQSDAGVLERDAVPSWCRSANAPHPAVRQPVPIRRRHARQHPHLRVMGGPVPGSASPARPRRAALHLLRRHLPARVGDGPNRKVRPWDAGIDYYDDPARPGGQQHPAQRRRLRAAGRQDPSDPALRQRQLVHARRCPGSR